MKKIALIVMLLSLCPCAAKGTITRVGTISFDRWEFNDCDKAVAIGKYESSTNPIVGNDGDSSGFIVDEDNTDIYLCGYSLEELLKMGVTISNSKASGNQ